MKIIDFYKLVRDMRRAQLDYYRDRTYGRLMAAKNLERQVDTELRAGPEKQEQPTATQTSFMEAHNEENNH